MPLKAGSLNDFDNSMAREIEREFESAWIEVKGNALPEMGRKDRRILFMAIARGILGYLKAKEEEAENIHLFSKITVQGIPIADAEWTCDVQDIEWNIDDL